MAQPQPTLAFMRQHGPMLGFGLVMALCSSFGQTFFVSLFGAEIRAEFHLTHGGFGSLYSAATLASAACLPWLGRRLDHTPLRLYAGAVLAGLALACAGLAVAPAQLAVVAALFGLRLCGQGLSMHTGITTMARVFGPQRRGTALAIAGIGLPLGQAVLPTAAVALTAAVGWRLTWWAACGFVGVVLLPLVLTLLSISARARPTTTDTGEQPSGSWSRAQVLRDARFYLAQPALLTPMIVLTGLFFHQAELASSKGWSLEWMATGFAALAVANVAASLFGGRLVDEVGARPVVVGSLAPLAIGWVVLAVSDHPAAAMVYMVLSGVGIGTTVVGAGALWPELYGTKHLGAIRAVVSATMVFGTALAPAAFGWLLDAGVGFDVIAGTSAAAAIVSAVVFAFGVRHS